MSEFTKWLKRRNVKESFGSDPSDRFKFNGDPDVAGDYERDQKDLVKLLSTKYQNDFHEFIKRLAEERGDHELMTLMRRCQTDNRSPDPWKVTHSSDRDEVVPPEADRGGEHMGAE
jgi:hypothetical protein